MSRRWRKRSGVYANEELHANRHHWRWNRKWVDVTALNKEDYFLQFSNITAFNWSLFGYDARYVRDQGFTKTRKALTMKSIDISLSCGAVFLLNSNNSVKYMSFTDTEGREIMPKSDKNFNSVHQIYKGVAKIG